MGKNNDEAKEIGEASKVVTQTRKKKKEAESPWNFPDFIPPPPFPTAEEALEKKKQFANMAVMIINIYVDMPLAVVIACAPKYIKFV